MKYLYIQIYSELTGNPLILGMFIVGFSRFVRIVYKKTGNLYSLVLLKILRKIKFNNSEQFINKGSGTKPLPLKL